MNLDLENRLNIPASGLVGRMVAVLGITGSGKTNTAAVLIEELLASGLPLTIVDIEGEYYGLKERFEILVAGQGEHVDLAVGVEQAAPLAELSIKKGISIVLDVSEFEETERFEFLLSYFNALWEANFRERKPYSIILEEAHEFIPQAARTPLKTIVTRLALRGRKRGFGVILMSQRSAKVDKDVLTQASISFLHKVIHPTDIEVYKSLIPRPAKEVEQMIAGLSRGEAIVMHEHDVTVAHIRLRHTLHVGATPELAGHVDFKPKKIDASLLKEFEKLRAVTKPRPQEVAKEAGPDKKQDEEIEKRLQERIAKLEKALATSQAKVKELQERLARTRITTLKPPENGPAIPALERMMEEEVNELVTTSGAARTDGMAIAAAVKEPEVRAATGLRKELNPTEQGRLNRVLRKVAALSTLETNIFKVLLESNAKMLPQDLAAWTGYSFSSIRHQRLLSLIRTGLVDYYNPGYKSNVLNFAQTAFPGVEPEVIISQIRNAL